jgi:hypothetical protein
MFSLLGLLRGLHLVLWIAAVVITAFAWFFLALPLVGSELMTMMGGQYLITSALSLLALAVLAFFGWLSTAICRAIWDGVRSAHLPSHRSLEGVANRLEGTISDPTSPSPKFVLFLNSQEVDPPILLLGQPHLWSDFPLTIDEAMAAQFSRSLPLVGILEDEGKRRRGVAEIFVTRQTKAEVLNRLWDTCEFAVVVPGAADALLREIASASAHPERSRKMVLVKPPNIDDATAVEWDVARSRAQALNIDLPDSPKGMVFTLAGSQVTFDQPKEIAKLVLSAAGQGE